MNFKKKISQIKNIKVSKNVTIVEPCNLYECELGENVFIGPFVEIQRNVKIGNNTRVQSHSFICEKVVIGKDCFISHGCMFINDLFKNGQRAKGDQSKWKETNIGNNVNIGSNCTILPVNISNDVTIGAGSVVTKDLLQAGIYFGNPARRKND